MGKEAKRNAFRAKMMQAWNEPYGKCLAPWACDKPPIRAHTVQREGPLRALASNGHVVMFGLKIDLSRPPNIAFTEVGVKKATAFTGLCAEHDTKLFRSLDNNRNAPRSQKDLFLLAYRAVLRGAHVCNEMASKHLRILSERPDLAEIDTLSLRFTAERIAIGEATWRYKKLLDEVLLDQDFAFLKHDILELDSTGPCVAASNLISLVEGLSPELHHLSVNVFPVADKTIAIFSCTDFDFAPTRRILKDLLSASGDNQAYLLSRFLLERCENFALNPDRFSHFSPTKRHAIRSFFCDTLAQPSILEFYDERLNLFKVDA